MTEHYSHIISGYKDAMFVTNKRIKKGGTGCSAFTSS